MTKRYEISRRESNRLEGKLIKEETETKKQSS